MCKLIPVKEKDKISLELEIAHEKYILEYLKKYSLIEKIDYSFLKEDYDILKNLKQRNSKLYHSIIFLNKTRLVKATIEARRKVITYFKSIYQTEVTEDRWQNILNKTKGICPECKENVGIQNLTKDHIIPKILGGKNIIENLQPLCLPCNIKKKCKIENNEVTRNLINKIGLKKGYNPETLMFLMEVEEIVCKALTEKEYKKYRHLLEVWSIELAKKYLRQL